ncbi:hypothetical protein GCM10009733_023290 [Nonomuraea maheshkhaliensis]|uniref:Helix-turn-helix domain-containing protein n=1 Tax=Nonomuraea maheshkhaliensis TaxID=419590 RepID=A0ABP4QWZ4_9ACTN
MGGRELVKRQRGHKARLELTCEQSAILEKEPARQRAARPSRTRPSGREQRTYDQIARHASRPR